MGNYSTKLFNSNNVNDIKIKDHCNISQESCINSGLESQKDEKLEQSLDNIGVEQTPIKKNYTLESRKKINAIPKYLQNEKIRKPYLETDLDSINQKHWLDPRSPNIAYPRTPILLQNDLNSPTKNDNADDLLRLTMSSEDGQCNAIDLDPRSPASDFNRTPISSVNMTKPSDFQYQNNVNRFRKSNSSIDICIKLSYCETTSLFNIPETQALPDIVVSLKRSYSLTDNLNEKSPSSIIDNVNVKSELISDDLHSVKLCQSSENFSPISQDKLETVKNTCIEKNTNETNEKYSEVSNNISKSTIDQQKGMENKIIDSEEKFKVWRDSHSKLPGNSFNSNLNNSETNSLLPEKEEILIEFDDCSIMNSVKTNSSKKIEKTEVSTKEKRVKYIEKQNPETLKENILLDAKKLFSPEFKTAVELPKNRTPFSNRSNSNGRIHALIAKSPQQFLGHKKLFINEKKFLQENTPPTHKKRVNNVPIKLNSTQWDSDSTIII